MKLATTREQMRKWVDQWRETGIYLEEIKRDELANMTDEDGWRAINAIQSIRDGWRNSATVCGLIEQQAHFAKLRK